MSYSFREIERDILYFIILVHSQTRQPPDDTDQQLI